MRSNKQQCQSLEMMHVLSFLMMPASIIRRWLAGWLVDRLVLVTSASSIGDVDILLAEVRHY